MEKGSDSKMEKCSKHYVMRVSDFLGCYDVMFSLSRDSPSACQDLPLHRCCLSASGVTISPLKHYSGEINFFIHSKRRRFYFDHL